MIVVLFVAPAHRGHGERRIDRQQRLVGPAARPAAAVAAAVAAVARQVLMIAPVHGRGRGRGGLGVAAAQARRLHDLLLLLIIM